MENFTLTFWRSPKGNVVSDSIHCNNNSLAGFIEVQSTVNYEEGNWKFYSICKAEDYFNIQKDGESIISNTFITPENSGTLLEFDNIQVYLGVYKATDFLKLLSDEQLEEINYYIDR